MKYRKLTNEILQASDRCWSDVDVSDETFHSCALSVGERNIGSRASDWNPGFWRRPVKEHNWISFAEREPTKEDRNIHGQILIRCHNGSCGLFRWNTTSAPHWMPLNFVEETPAPIKVDGHEVIPNKDGSVKVGCKTVSKEDFEEIVRQRSEVMKS